MKKITYLFIALITLAFSFSAKAQCNYTIELTDSWGDGWNGVSNMDVLVNGAVVLDDIGVSDPPGDAASFQFAVNPGDDITTVFNPAATTNGPDWASECGFRILDALGNEVFASNFGTNAGPPADVTTGTITASCPSCDVPDVSYAVVSNCPSDADFTIDVTINGIGAATSVTISDDQGTGTQQVLAGAVPTTINYGAYANGTPVVITVTNDDDGACATSSSALTFDSICPPSNDDCGTATSIVQETGIPDAASATGTAGTINGATDSGLAAEVCNSFTGNANDDVWYSFEALTADVNITFEVFAFDAVVQLYEGTCGALVNIGCADDTVTGSPAVEEVNATGLTPGTTYYVRIYQYGSAATDAGDIFDVKIWSPTTLSNGSIENQNSFTFYPNPVNNKLTLNAINNIQKVAVYNMLGQEVMRATPNNLQGELDMSSLQSGAYFVKVSINDVTETIRIIKR